MPDLQQLREILQSKNPRIQVIGWGLVLAIWLPVGVSIFENPDKSIAARVGEVARSIGYMVGGVVLLTIKPDAVTDQQVASMPPTTEPEQ